MSDFRRFVISIAEGVLIIGIVLGTISMAMVGMSIGSALSFASGAGGFSGGGLIGFFVGGGVGFVVSAAASAVVFMLAETAEHSKRTADNVQCLVDTVQIAVQALVPGIKLPSVEDYAQNSSDLASGSDEAKASVRVNDLDSQEVQDTIVRARSQGFQVAVADDTIIFENRRMNLICRTADDVRVFAAANLR